jgi:hypothetical protein
MNVIKMKTFLKGKRFKSKTKIFCSVKFSGLVYNKLLVVKFYLNLLFSTVLNSNKW